MSKPKAPPPPDYSGVAAASEKSAQLSYDMAQQQLAWSKEQYGLDRETSNKVIDSALETQSQNNATALQDRARYEKTFQPLEDNLAQDAKDYSSQERQEFDAGRAQADVSQQFSQARTNAQQQLESFGIDPSQTRAQALDVSTRTQEAAARASAGNQARVQDQSVGRALRSEAINVGRGYPGQIAQQYGTATQSGNQAVNSGIATTATGAQTMGTPTQWQGLGNQAIASWGNTLNTGYQNQMSAFNANQKSSSGIGSLLGTGLGLAMMFEEGGAVDPDAAAAIPAPSSARTSVPQSGIPMGPAHHSGVPVPVSASPSHGAVTDDIPARLNAGEFVLPKDVVAWKGQEFFQKLIEGARKKQDGAEAKPRTQAIPALQTALPTG